MLDKQMQTLAALEEQWKSKVEQARREALASQHGDQEKRLAALSAEHDKRLAALTAEQKQALAQHDAQSKSLSARSAKLEQDVKEALAAITARDRLIEDQKRQLADQAQTITSLNAMIGDFSGRPVATTAAAEPTPIKKTAS